MVAIESPGISGTVADEASGLLAPRPEPGALASRMARIATEPQLGQRLADAARDAAGAYTLERTAGRLLKRFEEIAAAARD